MDIRILLTAAALVGATAVSAQAAEINLSSLVNANLSTYYNGGVYPPNGGSQTIGGVTFNLAPYPGGGTGIIQEADGLTDSLVIPIGQADVTTVYTIANSAFGVDGATIGSLTFTGSGGASYTYEFTEGTNIRDHATTSYNDIATGLYASKDYGGGDHLDVQQIILPSAFATQTLVSVTFDAVDAGQGDPFIAAITTGGVPEPAAWAMMLLGLGGVGACLRSRRKAVAAAI